MRRPTTIWFSVRARRFVRATSRSLATAALAAAIAAAITGGSGDGGAAPTEPPPPARIGLAANLRADRRAVALPAETAPPLEVGQHVEVWDTGPSTISLSPTDTVTAELLCDDAEVLALRDGAVVVAVPADSVAGVGTARLDGRILLALRPAGSS